MNIVKLMAAPFVECLVLVAIHTYLGLHVLRRRVIFVDLALAQIAALGTTVGFLFGIMPETPGSLMFSIAFASVGAAVFAVTRFRHERVPQEAIIGLTYAICCAVAVLVVEKTKSAEHLKDILVGNLLWVKWSDVASAAAAYSGVGVIHYLFRGRFFLISDDAEAARAQGLHVRLWDFLFYVTFGVVIAFSTRVAGVLLVFVFLVAPGVLAFALTQRLSLQLLVGWVAGTIVTVAGLYLSWRLDLPSGPAVIAFYGIVLAVGGAAIFVWRAQNRKHAMLTVATGLSVSLVLGFAFYGAGTWLGRRDLSVSDEARVAATEVVNARMADKYRDEARDEARRRILSSRISRCVGSHKLDRYLSMPGPEEQLAHAKVRLNQNVRRGVEFLLIALTDDDTPLLYREEASDLLRVYLKKDFGYDPLGDPVHNDRAIRDICDRIGAMKKAERREGSESDSQETVY